jgi:hypothetical protein
LRKRRKKTLVHLVIILTILGMYPFFVLSYTWAQVSQSGLEGGRHGPKDAYRHVLASAVVAYTLHPRAVALFTLITESKGKDTNTMDAHNNRIGASIGSGAGSFSELPHIVLSNVLEGGVNTTNDQQVTWLPEQRWKSGLLW